MAYASKLGRANISSRFPRAAGVCDRCGFVFSHHKLVWQFDFAGSGLINKMILVCHSCTDQPQEQLRSFALASDPVPIMNARVQDYLAASTDYIFTNEDAVIDQTTGLPIPQGKKIVTQNDKYLNFQPLGNPSGLDQNAVVPLKNQTVYRVALSVLSIFATGTTVISVTCSSAHNLATNDQVAIQGTLNSVADGFYNVVVTNPLAFTYEVATPIANSGLLQSSTLVLTADAGVPRGFNQIPQTGTS